jgi:GDA1/CD39 (nucleoside phosphatase) family
MIEDIASFDLYQKRSHFVGDEATNDISAIIDHHRRLKKHKNKNKDDGKDNADENEFEGDDLHQPNSKHTQHGMMIDAGSQGTRVHVYEFKSRILSNTYDIRQAVAGLKLSYPTTDTRWTNRLKPGVRIIISI